MKRSERHHLKDNTFASWMAERGRAVGFVAVAVLLAVVAAGAYAYWRSQEAARADARLTDALATSEAPVVPPAADTQPQPGTFSTETARLDAALPKFLAVGEEHPGSRAAIPARYH